MLTGSFIAELLCIMEAIIRTLGSWSYLALSPSTAMTTRDLSLSPFITSKLVAANTNIVAGIIQI